MQALDRVRAREDKPRLHPALYEMLAIAGRDEGGVTGFVLERPFLVDTLVVGDLLKKPQTRALITDTVNITGFAGALQPNVVPSEVYAQIDSRLLPGTRPEDVLAELKELTADVEGISFEVIDARAAAVSTWDDPLYRALAHHAPSVVDEGQRVAVGPFVSLGFTDSVFLRGKGVIAYGFVPVAVTPEEASTMHGDAEHVSKVNVTRGLRALTSAVVDVAAR
jgi:acetylornithine deacetylase/succinyl-diaminopimelate desuccinylase-like protein